MTSIASTLRTFAIALVVSFSLALGTAVVGSMAHASAAAPAPVVTLPQG